MIHLLPTIRQYFRVNVMRRRLQTMFETWREPKKSLVFAPWRRDILICMRCLVFENEEDTPGKNTRKKSVAYCDISHNKEIKQTLSRSLRLAIKLLTADCIINLRLLMLRIICWLKRTEFSSTSPTTLSAILENELSERRLGKLTVDGLKFYVWIKCRV